MADTGRYPYGPRPLDEVRDFARQITASLVASHDVKMVVVACNTAAAAALDLLRFEYEVPLVGVIDPGVRAAIKATATQPHRCHRHGRHDRVGRLPTSRGGPAGPHPPDLRGLSGFRGVRRAGRDPLRPGPRPGRAAARPLAPGPGGHPAARLHPLPVSGPDHRRRDGPRRGAWSARRTRRRSRSGPSWPTRASAGAAPARACTVGSPRATRRASASSAGACSVPRSTTWSNGTRATELGRRHAADRARVLGELRRCRAAPAAATSCVASPPRSGSTPARAPWPTCNATSASTRWTRWSCPTSIPTTGPTSKGSSWPAATCGTAPVCPSTHQRACAT